MSKGKYRFSPLAVLQLDAIWDYGYRRFGEQQADQYLEELFVAIEEVAACGRYKGLHARMVPPDKIADITKLPARYIHCGRHYLYLRELADGATGVICILSGRMDTPARLRESLASTRSKIDE